MNTTTAHEARWTVPYTLVTGYASNARVWASSASDAQDRARTILARGGCPEVASFGAARADGEAAL